MRNYSFGNYLRDLRVKKNLSQAELGELLCVTKKNVAKWESGRICPSMDLISPLATVLDADETEMRDRMNHPENSTSSVRKLLDLLLLPAKSRLIALSAVWVICYIFSLLFSDIQTDPSVIFMPFLISGFILVGVYFVIGVQRKNPECPRFFWIGLSFGLL